MEPKTHTSGRFPYLVLNVILCAVVSRACCEGRNAASAGPPAGGAGKYKNRSLYERSADDRSAGIIQNRIPKGGAPFGIDSRAAGRAWGFYTKPFATDLKDPHIFAGKVYFMERSLPLSANAGFSNAYPVSERGRHT